MSFLSYGLLALLNGLKVVMDLIGSERSGPLKNVTKGMSNFY